MANPNPVATPPIPQLYNHPRILDPLAALPARLQLRIDDWLANEPTSQFKTYGPIAAYLHTKFSPEFFLIKPQAYLSSVAPQGAGHRRVDSHGMAVDNDRLYPDFTVCQYFGADDDPTPPDIIRVVYEIGTNTDDISKNDSIRQLKTYIETVTDRRYDTRLLGVAQAGNKVCLIQHEGGAFKKRTPWISLFDPRYVQKLNEMRDLAYLNDQALQNDHNAAYQDD